MANTQKRNSIIFALILLVIMVAVDLVFFRNLKPTTEYKGILIPTILALGIASLGFAVKTINESGNSDPDNVTYLWSIGFAIANILTIGLWLHG